jgi:hypothetical protein
MIGCSCYGLICRLGCQMLRRVLWIVDLFHHVCCQQWDKASKMADVKPKASGAE